MHNDKKFDDEIEQAISQGETMLEETSKGLKLDDRVYSFNFEEINTEEEMREMLKHLGITVDEFIQSIDGEESER